MIKQILAILTLIFSLSTYGQISDSLKIDAIDYETSLIPENPSKDDPYNIIQSSGLIRKNTFFGKKRIGNFHENVIYKNGSISLIKIYTNLKDKSTIEYFYYDSSGDLIRYNKVLQKLHIDNVVSEDTLILYFHSSKVISETDSQKEIDTNEILERSDQKKSSWNDFIKQTDK